MRLLVHTPFHPSVGGIETVASLLTREWHRSGVEVVVVSDVHGGPGDEFPFNVYYRPTPVTWMTLIQASDVFIHMNISLKALWPLMLAPRPFVAVHHGGYFVSRDNDRDWRERTKLRVARKATRNIAVSRYIADVIGTACEIIPNPYDDDVFHSEASSVRERLDLIFVGRLISDKGCDLLIRALKSLAIDNLHPRLTIVGDGPARASLERQVATSGLKDRVSFTGSCPPARVAELLRQHEILVIPSLVEESFGIVALEGAACGCVVLGADAGGLPEAIGPAGLTFARGRADDLAAKIGRLLTHPADRERYRAGTAVHLNRHRASTIADRYLAILERLVPG